MPYDTFYISELVDKVDIKKDYLEWLRRKNLRVSGGGTHIFFSYIPTNFFTQGRYSTFQFKFFSKTNTNRIRIGK